MATSRLLFEDLDNKILKENLLSSLAEQTVNSFKQFDRQRNRDKKDNPSTTQLRRFYNDLLTLKNKIDFYSGEEKEKQFKKLLPFIKAIKAKVAYAKTRGNVNAEFKQFIDQYIDSISDLDDFYAFCDFFEAIIAYAPLYLKK